MSETNELLRVGRPVYVKAADEFGVIVEYESAMDLWLVDCASGLKGAWTTEEIEPLFTLRQVVNVKVEEETTPALVRAVIPFGMTSDQLAETVAREIGECASRIKGVGNDQYNQGGHQKFEELDLDELIEYSMEELQDVCNYTVFLMIRLRRIQEALGERDDLGVGTEEEFAETDYSVEDFKEEDSG